MSNPSFEIVLEKKGRGRGAFSLSRPWAIRDFKLVEQSLEYYDKTKLKGTIEIANAKVYAIDSAEGENKPFPFIIDTGAEKIFFNATTEDTRKLCLDVFTRASKDKNWNIPIEVAAPTAAVIAIMKEDVEVAKIDKQIEKLEEERKEEVQEQAAAIFQEELAKKAMREAAEAEKKQREEQERQVTELLKSLGVKQRFRAAMQRGRIQVARECAACMLQGSWRSKQAHRRMLKKKAEKEALRREAYARKIQCRYRQRLARRKVLAIKEEKQRLKERRAALRVQSRWRMHLAKRVYQHKQDKKLEAEYSRSLKKMRGLIKFQTAVRRFLAISRLARRRRIVPTISFLTIDKCEGFNFPEVGYVELHIIVSGCVILQPQDAPPIKMYSRRAADLIQAHGKITSHSKVEMSATSNKMGIVTSLHQMDFIIVTAYDKNNGNELLGQAIISVQDVRDAAKITGSSKIEVSSKFHDELIIPILDENNQPLVHYRKPTVGHVAIFAIISDPSYSQCGWLWKVSESLLSNAWKRRWFVLADGHITYYNSDLHLDASKNTICCEDVTSITEEKNHRGRDAIKIIFHSNNIDNDWIISFDENESKLVRNMWLRKLKRSCPRVPQDREVPASLSPGKATGSGKARRHNSVYFNPDGQHTPKTHIPVAKRMSIFKASG